MVNQGKYADGSVTEEVSATGERLKGAVKDGVGAVTGNRSLERQGERENAEGRARQANNMVTGMYDSPESAGKAYDDLTSRHGYTSGDISVVMSDDTRKKHFGHGDASNALGTKAAEGAGIGGGIGIGVGAAIGALVAAATAIAIPGLGLIVAGPIAGAIAGAGAGGATGTLIGGLVGAGIPEDRAAEYERDLKDGGIVIGTRARDEAHAAALERDFTSYGARNVQR